MVNEGSGFAVVGNHMLNGFLLDYHAEGASLGEIKVGQYDVKFFAHT
jgi:hypothetical protein